jgi:hypothetical protein
MVAPIVLYSDVQVLGTITGNAITVPSGTITNAMVNAAANIGASKMQHEFLATYAQESATNAVSEQRVVHAAKGATATITQFGAGAVVLLTGADTCTVDLLKNGASILTAVISLLSSDTIRVIKFATLSSTSLVVGDVLEVKTVVSHTSGTLPKGVFARALVVEDSP